MDTKHRVDIKNCVAVPPDCLQRAVEGRAASDDEGEEDGRRRDEEPFPEGKKQTGRLHDCGYQLLANLSIGSRDNRRCCYQLKQSSKQPGRTAVIEKDKVGKRFAPQM